MSYIPTLAAQLCEKIEANNKQMEELKQQLAGQIKEANLTGAPYSNAESTLSDMEKLSAQIEVDYRRLELETIWAPEVS